MSEPDAQRWDLPSVEGASMPRPGAKGVNVMHLTLVEREAWQHGFKDGHVEGVRKGEAELAKRIAEVDVKIAALDAIIGTLARPAGRSRRRDRDRAHAARAHRGQTSARRELRIDPTQIIGIIRHTVSLLPLSARNIKIQLHPDDAAIVRGKLTPASGQQEWTLAEDPLMARGGCRLTTDNSSIDARFEAAVAAALSGLLGDDRTERPAARPRARRNERRTRISRAARAGLGRAHAAPGESRAATALTAGGRFADAHGGPRARSLGCQAAVATSAIS
jgi:flagellar assembly protein FliH